MVQTKKVWWICSKGHSYQSTIANRTNGKGCPYCSGNKILKSYNDLATLAPNLLKKWDYENNEKNGINPDVIGIGYGKKV